MSRTGAGAALRALRESRDWSLADLAAATGVSIMGLSYLERGARKPHKGTVQKVENGLGLPPGTYSRLLAADDPKAELAQLTVAAGSEQPRRSGSGPVVVTRHSDADVLEAHAQAHIDSLNSLIEHLPTETSNEYETYILSVIGQCVTAEMLTANSWRVAVNAGAETTGRLMAQLRTLEDIRTRLLGRMPSGIGSRFDQACRSSGLPAMVIAGLLGVSHEEMWDIRNRGRIPPGVLPRVRAFVEAQA
ncbi:MAG: helix-turn-helix transcriptional regulator [Mycobacterium sp.]|nr:helix-turn-helix transcriptional regulator [Mycobacterium sp.]